MLESAAHRKRHLNCPRRNFSSILECCLRGDAVFGDVGGLDLVAPHNVNNVSYVTDINHESHFAWQAQYLVTLEDESCCSAHCKRPSIMRVILRGRCSIW